MKNNVLELKFKVSSFRKIPNPYYTLTDGDKTPEMYIMICDIHDVPNDIPMNTNPREQNLKTNVAKKIKDSLLEPAKLDFYLLNRGLLLSADTVTYDNTNNVVNISFTDLDVHGNVDGGHTYTIIKEFRDQIDKNQQFVKIEVLTHIESIFESLAAARNTSVQVKDKSIAELEKRFELIKDAFKTESFYHDISYKENQNKRIDVSVLLAILNLFNIDRYQDMKNYPINSYSSNKQCVDIYINESKNNEQDENKNPYVKMKPIMVDIVKLYDMLESNMAKYYKGEDNGIKKYGAVTGVVTRKPGKPRFTSKFYETDMEYVSPNGFIYPVLGAFRALVHEEDGIYKWKKNPFKILENVGSILVGNTVNMSRSLGNNPNATGKNTNLWQVLYMTVKMQVMSEL
ncbi:MAG: AIPR family protein [Candidatus Delongbacteria bacterium]|nr:AIPR family protein [Candidatus Delongbacteria bacterium]